MGVEAYQALGYLPAALRNYLVRLGWSHGDQEFFSTEEMASLFDLPAIGRSAARFDFVKLEHINGHYMRASSDAELVDAIAELLVVNTGERGWPNNMNPLLRDQLMTAMPGLKDRAKTLVELVDQAYYLYAVRPLTLEAKATLLIEAGRDIMRDCRPRLAALDVWTVESIEVAIRQEVDEKGIKLGQIAQPLRATLTGRSTSPGLFDVMAVLGQSECLARIDDQIGH